MLTERENYLKVIRGEKPEWVPYYRDCAEWTIPCFLMQFLGTEEKLDIFGTPWTINENGPMPDSRHKPILEDIADWKSVLNLPDLDAVDWEACAAFDMQNHDPNKAIEGFTCQGSAGNYFLPIMAMMGFEEGLLALAMDPESVMEFCEYMSDFYIKLVDYIEKYYHPDVYVLADDFCTARGPMISWNTYETLFRPYYKKLIDHIKETSGKPIQFHMCGKGEQFVDDFYQLGVRIWQPAQPMNDLLGFREKYGNSLIFTGTWQGTKGEVPGVSEEVVRESVRECIEQYGKDGGLIIWDGDPVGTSEDMMNKIAWVADEVRTFGRTFYQY